MTDHSTSTTHLTVPPEPAPQCIFLVSLSSVASSYWPSSVRYRYWHLHRSSAIPRPCQIWSGLVSHLRKFKSPREASNTLQSVEGGNQTEDENGHGTHCAGVAVSSQLYVVFVQFPFLYVELTGVLVTLIYSGVAKSASVIAVKVLTDDFGGRVSDV